MKFDHYFTEDDVSSVAEALKKRVADQNGSLAETLGILSDGSIELPTKPGDKMVSFFAHMGSGSIEELMHLALLIVEKYPELNFTFENDPEGKWIKYSVTEST